MNQRCFCTHPMHAPTVVVGGRYVVGENPTFRDPAGPQSRPWLVSGLVVTAYKAADRDGNAWVRIPASDLGYAIDPRHLTPAPEPAAAPAVDDDLLAQVRAALTAAGIELIHTDRDLPDAVRDLARQRDEARATKDMHKERQQELETALNAAVRERDEARTDAAHSERWQERALQAEAKVERLRAAQQLPDVGPVTRDAGRHLLTVDQISYAASTSAEEYRRWAARNIALAAFLDAEAADTSSDDEVETVARVLLEHGVTDDEGHGTVAEVAIAVRDALRARGGQEEPNRGRGGEKHNPWDAQCARNVLGEPTHENARCGTCRGGQEADRG